MTVLIGSLAGMMPFSCPSSEASDEDNAVTVVRTGAGAYAMQAPHRGLRSWRLGVGAASPQEQSALQGVLRYAALPLVFVSEAAAGINGLTPAQSAMHSSCLPTGVSRGGSELVQDEGGTFRVAWSAGTTLTAEWVLDGSGPPCPVIPGGPVTIAAGLRASGSLAPRIGVDWIRSTGTVISRQMVTTAGVTSTQPLVRAHATLTAPADAVAARLVFHRATQVAAPSITLTPELRPYGEGDGAPEVVPMSASRSLLMATPGATYGAHDLTLQEVGLAVR